VAVALSLVPIAVDHVGRVWFSIGGYFLIHNFLRHDKYHAIATISGTGAWPTTIT